MPVFKLETNVKSLPSSIELKRELTTLVSEHLGKPEKFVAVVMVTGVDMSFAATEV
jgi:phenylpyruvate tautomerase PptA (4-oxalocrotonate tautomerase family)